MCDDDTRVDMVSLERATIDALKEALLAPELADAVIQVAKRHIEAALKEPDAATETLKAELQSVGRKSANLLSALENGKQRIGAVEERLAELESRRKEIKRELAEIGEMSKPTAIDDLDRKVREKIEKGLRRLSGGAMRKMRAYRDGRVYIEANLAPVLGTKFVGNSGRGDWI